MDDDDTISLEELLMMEDLSPTHPENRYLMNCYFAGGHLAIERGKLLKDAEGKHGIND